MEVTDNEVTSAFLKAARDEMDTGHLPAKHIMGREHCKMIYQRNPKDIETNPESAQEVDNAMLDKFGRDYFRKSFYKEEKNLIMQKNG